jgi:predicted nucleic acid-binding protein
MSKARARLFDLADLVRNGDDTVVILEERGSGEGVALVRESRLDYLEDAVKEREKLEPRPFGVAGSLIAATAVANGCPLMTRDPAFARIPSLTTVW